MWNQDGHSDFQIEIKTEPVDDQIDNGYHGNTDSMRDHYTLSYQDLYHENISSLKNKDSEGCNHSNTKQEINNDDSDTEDCDYGNTYEFSSEMENSGITNQKCDVPYPVKLWKAVEHEDGQETSKKKEPVSEFVSTMSTSSMKMNLPQPEFNNILTNSAFTTTVQEDITENQGKSRNRRKRKETVRRLKTCNIDQSDEDETFGFNTGEKEYDTCNSGEKEYDTCNSGEKEHDTCNSGCFVCHLCQVVFTDAKAHHIHVKKCLTRRKLKRKKTNTEHKCEICGKVFKDRRGLDRHEVVHSGVKPYQCAICERSYTQKGHLQQHQRMHNDREDPLECEYCFKISQRQDKYTTHKNFHYRSKNMPYLCNACGGQFQEKSDLVKHIIKHRNTELYYVQVVQESKLSDENKPRSKSPLKKPKLKNLSGSCSGINCNKAVEGKLGKFLFVCQLCKKEFIDWFTIQQHISRHTGEKVLFTCETCSKEFESTDDFAVHQKEHAPNYVTKCEICGKFLNSNTDLLTHKHIHQVLYSFPRQQPTNGDVPAFSSQKEATVTDEAVSGTCTEENEHSDSNDNVNKEHKEDNSLQDKTEGQQKMNSVQDDNQDASVYNKVSQYMAENCHMESIVASNFRYNVPVNDPSSKQGQADNTFEVDQSECVNEVDKKINMASNLKNAINTHERRGQFICNVCGMIFDRMNLFRLHAAYCGNIDQKVKVHVVGRKKKYECPICGKLFPDRRGIERHGVVHSGIKAYECTVCGRSYTQKGHLELHMKKHSDNFFERFECPYCFKILEKKDRFVIHKASHMSEFPYTCNVCNSSMRLLQDLYEHFKTHEHHQFYYVENKIGLGTPGEQAPEESVHTAPSIQQVSNDSTHTVPPIMPIQIFDSDKLQELSNSQLKLREEGQHLCDENHFIFVCQICHKQFQTWQIMLEHVDRHFGMTRQFTCETCNTVFNTVENLKQHLDEHKKNFQNICTVCKKFFLDEDGLKEHFVIHKRFAQKRSFYVKQPNLNRKRRKLKEKQDTIAPL
ncbi:zinc finger protein 184-like [Mytilus californianus]|uniref:zinc finger protein 184-like n=1 Tax=Mytilus californianus TaxID=6549 RepID=UPI002246FCB9|nr:zinc finger protein 184-like [Mytilus californianus]